MSTLYLANYGPHKFRGVIRCTTDHWIDEAPTALRDKTHSILVVPGLASGKNEYVIDVACTLNSGEFREVSLHDMVKAQVQAEPVTSDMIGRYGHPTIGGVELQIKGITPDGYGYRVHYSAYVAKMIRADMWFVYYPAQPGAMYGELVLRCTNPREPQFVEVLDKPLLVTWPHMDVRFDGLMQSMFLMEKGDSMCDGQARGFPFVAIRPDFLWTSDDYASAGLLVDRMVHAQALDHLWPEGGYPIFQGDAMRWVKSSLPGAQAALRTWVAPKIGVNQRSADTGKQEDQLFKGGECFRLPGGILPRYFAAMSQWKRPCHHLEYDGSQLKQVNHPGLVMWDGRPHWHTGVSPDRLGKEGSPNAIHSHGWWGPDEEHWLISTLAAAARLTGSPALQEQLNHHATNFLFSKTIEKHISTSRPGAARAVGYEGYVAWLLWHTLADRTLADHVLTQAVNRIRYVHLPHLDKLNSDIWDLRVDDNRLGKGSWWMPWQQALGAWGMTKLVQLAQRTEAYWPEGGRMLEHCRRAAQKVITDAYRLVDDRWVASYALSLDGQRNDSDYSSFGCPLAAAALIHIGTEDETVRNIWDAALAMEDQNWVDPTLRLRS